MNAITVPEITAKVTVPVSVLTKRDELLAKSALLPDEVIDQAGNDAAVDVASQLKALSAEVEKARKKVKEPVLDLGRQIDAAAKGVTDPLNTEIARLLTATANYQTAQLERIREQERRRAEEERRIAEEHAASGVDPIIASERTAQELQALAPIASSTAAGQSAKIEWDYEVTDIHLLARMHPGLVKIEPVRSEIKEVILRLAMDGTPKIAGLRLFQTTKVDVRAAKPGRTLDV